MRRTKPFDFAHDVLGFVLDSLVEAQKAPDRETANACLSEAAGAIPCLWDALEDAGQDKEARRSKAKIQLVFEGEGAIQDVIASNDDVFAQELARLREHVSAAFRAAGGQPSDRYAAEGTNKFGLSAFTIEQSEEDDRR
ncbi:hypothetical protein [Methylobacterium planeticum]|uniref:Uncharacterized protein n=1 Tax=Methylobacterium planeticum TaxID=2615211 RepID=A0A6N6MDP0_9HYPH|nr:hypothetical protein [Methylobacterium planeticum]KAB1068820.1 hypothetical protein F6X51_26255 [Methylobacterium planeticum]